MNKWSFQEESEAPRAIGVLTEGPAQLMEDSQAEVTARCKPDVANIRCIRRKVKETFRKADEEDMEERKYEEARAAKLEAGAEEAKCNAEAAEREYKAAGVAEQAARGPLLGPARAATVAAGQVAIEARLAAWRWQQKERRRQCFVSQI
jgi:hypothetical protein